MDLYLLGPTKSLTVTKALVAFVRTAAFELPKAVFKKSIKLLKDSPAMPNSIRALSIQLHESARTFGAFCFDKGS